MQTKELEQMISKVVQEIIGKASAPSTTAPIAESDIALDVPDITEINLQEALYVENPANPDMYVDLMRSSPARLGVGRAGPRQNYRTMLRFRADHAAAMDAVLTDVSDERIKELGLFVVESSALDKAEYLMDPAKGRVFNAETKQLIKQNCKASPQIQIIVTDGLSSIAVENNISDVLPALEQGLQKYGLQCGTPLFVKRGRVGIMDAASELLQAEVAILFVGERPGLVTNESLSCYMTYKGYPGMAESARTVVSNIYKDGTPPSEAGAHIAELAKKMLELKAGGLELNVK